MHFQCFTTEKYTRGVSAVESILTLDRLRQNVAIKELEQNHGQPLSMRKTVSVPNFSQVSQWLNCSRWSCTSIIVFIIFFLFNHLFIFFNSSILNLLN